MTSGPPVQLPPIAIGVLNNIRCHESSRVEVYFLSSSTLSPASLTSVCDSLIETYVHDLLGDEQVEDYHQFLTPILTPFASVQECIEHHFDGLDKWLLEHPTPQEFSAVHPHGILVIDRDEQEALLVHVDCINKEWHIGSIYLPIVDLEVDLTSLLLGDEFFGDLCDRYDVRVPQNDPDIDENYKEHQKDETGAWKNNPPRFAVFSTGWLYALPVEGMLDDAHADAPLGHGDANLYSLTGGHYLGEKERLRARFPAYVAADQRGERRHEGKGPCASCRPLHKNIFIEVDNSEPQTKGVLVCTMDWDGNTNGKSDDQLADVGLEARIETKRVGVAFAVATAKAISSSLADQKPRGWQEKT
ncbi:hypothetical protein KCU71_g9780, partial [Aureobasidium melanogenum]